MTLDPLDPDAPIIALLSLDASPFLADMSIEELTSQLQRARELSQPTQSTIPSISLSDTTTKTPRPPSKKTKLKALLDSL